MSLFIDNLKNKYVQIKTVNDKKFGEANLFQNKNN